SPRVNEPSVTLHNVRTVKDIQRLSSSDCQVQNPRLSPLESQTASRGFGVDAGVALLDRLGLKILNQESGPLAEVVPVGGVVGGSAEEGVGSGAAPEGVEGVIAAGGVEAAEAGK